MKKALEQAKLSYEKGEIPIGCIIVRGEEIIAMAHNTKENENNSLCHAEMIALNHAQKYLNSKYLNDCDMYLTVEPCAMCAGAMLSSRLGKLIFGAREPKTGCAGSLYNILSDSRFSHKIEVKEGILEKECSDLMKDFFKERRNKC